MKTYRFFCDESCHQEHDHHKSMVIGAIWCDAEDVVEFSDAIKGLKEEHGISRHAEIKWTKVSPSMEAFYLDLIDFFFKAEILNFRAVVIPDKSHLDHAAYGQSHDDWYYKMYYLLLDRVIDSANKYEIFLDIKDTRSATKLQSLREILGNARHDFKGETITNMQHIHSHEAQLMQLADLLIGALSYSYRELTTSSTKLSLIARIKRLSGNQNLRSTSPDETKFNVFAWRGGKVE